MLKKNNKGFVSVEAVLAMTALMAVILLSIGFYVYNYPKIYLEKEVHLLAQKAKIQGGLTIDDVDLFKSRMEQKGHNKDLIEVYAVFDDNGIKKSAIGVSSLNDSNPVFYVKRQDLQTIEITVKIPANIKALKGPLEYFLISVGGLSDTYIFKESVLSERW